jgi:HpaII-like restriction endonuclease
MVSKKIKWKGNRGEWSEVYVFLKLLVQGKLYSADKDLTIIENFHYPIKKILRFDDDRKIEFEINEKTIKILDGNNGIVIGEKNISDFETHATLLLEKIKNSDTTNFSIPEIKEFMNSIFLTAMKAESTKTRDITIIHHDILTGINPIVGFSIKSDVGQPPTFLNASGQTNFIYKIDGPSISDKERMKLNTLPVKKLVYEIETSDRKLIFSHMQSEIFNQNLTMIDSFLPQIIEGLVLEYYRGHGKSLPELTQKVKEINPCHFNKEFGHIFYEYKIKNFLMEKALGLFPGTVWDGQRDATGGYIILKNNGDIVCYHVYNRKDFQEYLFDNTKLETAATKKRQTEKQKREKAKRTHLYGQIYNEKGNQYIKLNLQIRFVSKKKS